MKITTAILCDFAQVREGLLTIASGAITRMYRPQLPGPMNVCLGLVIQMDTFEAAKLHELLVHVVDEDGAQIATVTGGFQAAELGDLEVSEETQLPVALDLRDAGVARYGAHSVRIYIDGNHQHTLQFWVKDQRPGGLPAPN